MIFKDTAVKRLFLFMECFHFPFNRTMRFVLYVALSIVSLSHAVVCQGAGGDDDHSYDDHSYDDDDYGNDGPSNNVSRK